MGWWSLFGGSDSVSDVPSLRNDIEGYPWGDFPLNQMMNPGYVKACVYNPYTGVALHVDADGHVVLSDRDVERIADAVVARLQNREPDAPESTETVE